MAAQRFSFLVVVPLLAALPSCLRVYGLPYDTPNVDLCEDTLSVSGTLSSSGPTFEPDSVELSAYLGEDSDGSACLNELSIIVSQGGSFSGCDAHIYTKPTLDAQGRLLIDAIEFSIDDACPGWDEDLHGTYDSAPGDDVGFIEMAEVKELDLDTCYTGTTTIVLNQVVLSDYLDNTVTIGPGSLTIDGETYALSYGGGCPES